MADRLARDGEHVLVLDALSRPGVEENLSWLKRTHGARITPIIGDVRDSSGIVQDVAGIFHLAAQVAVTTSFAWPVDDLDINVRATLNLLEEARRCKHPPPFIFASTNKVYGDLGDIALDKGSDAYAPHDKGVREHGIGEGQPLSFHTPYGCSKGAADQYVLDYARAFGLPNTVMRMSCIYGPRQHGNEDQGWVAHFLISALRSRPITIYGDGRQVRDILYVDDAVEAYVRAYRNIRLLQGRPFNLGGGPTNAVSLLQVLARIEQLLGRRVEVSFSDWRPGDQRYYVSDRRRVAEALGLPEPRSWQSGLASLARWLAKSKGRSIEIAARTSSQVSP